MHAPTFILRAFKKKSKHGIKIKAVDSNFMFKDKYPKEILTTTLNEKRNVIIQLD